MNVELLDVFGNDLMVVNAARVSYGKFKNDFDEKDVRLIKYLVNSNPKHTAPFRHPQLQFRITCPIFVERQLFKHQVGLTANSISGRYVDFSDTYWTPSQLRLQSKSSKQGSGEDIENEDDNAHFCRQIANHIDDAKKLYTQMERYGIAKELCRIVLPLCLETTFIWTGSILAYLHLWNLRLKPDTQKETREVAQLMLDLVKHIDGNPFQYTLEAFGF